MHLYLMAHISDLRCGHSIQIVSFDEWTKSLIKLKALMKGMDKVKMRKDEAVKNIRPEAQIVSNYRQCGCH